MPRQYLKRAYVKAVIKEIRLWLEQTATNKIKWDTIYIGGGTPSVLTLDELNAIIEELPKSDIKEFTIEANPEDVDMSWAKGIKSLGIDRVSIGIQSFSDSELKAVGRRHSSRQSYDALTTLRNAGFDNISADLIYGLPGQSLKSWTDSLETLLGFDPEHLSCYSLSFEPGTKLYAQLMAGKVKEADENLAGSMYEALITRTALHGYDHYEISNFGKPSMYSRHNSSYWTFSPYLGIGAAAHGYLNRIRYANPWNIKSYIDSVASGRIAADEEHLSVDDIYNEYIMVALRTSAGIDMSRLLELTDSGHHEFLNDRLSRPEIAEMVCRTPNGLRIPETSWLVSDFIIRELMI